MQLPHVPGELVEHEGQGERHVLVLHARVAGHDRALAQVRGGLLDQLPVDPVLLDPASVPLVVHVLLPVVALLVGARGKRARPASHAGGLRCGDGRIDQ